MTTRLLMLLCGLTVLLTSCLKQSIADAMLNPSGAGKVTATLSYEINGEAVSISVADAGRQTPGNRTLSCEKSNGYTLSGVGSSGDFVFTFFTDSLVTGNYTNTSSFGIPYVTTFQGRPQYIYGPSDQMSFNVTSYANGYISGNFSGRITPWTNPGYGPMGSVIIKNGLFTNVPVIY